MVTQVQMDIGELTAIRHWLHRHPEQGFEEYRTSEYLADRLRAYGVEIVPTSMGTGVIGVIQGGRPGPHIALRADIDGLPIEEDSGLPFTSKHHGTMHGCGHDLHMTGLLGAAQWLSAHREHIAGTITLVFQPSEETGQGARAVLQTGVLDGVEAMIGTHNNPLYRPGQLAIGAEPMMAGCVRFRVDIHAEGTHAAYPHRGTGPIEALAAMVSSLQTIASRNVSPFHPFVLSVTQVTGGQVWNVVPDHAQLQGTARYFHAEDGELAGRRFREVVTSTAAAFGVSAEVMWDDFQDPLVSDAALARAVAEEVGQCAELVPIIPSMAGEDFCEYGKTMRLVFAFVGSNGREGCAAWHSPQFVGLDESLPTFVRFYAHAALRVMEELR